MDTAILIVSVCLLLFLVYSRNSNCHVEHEPCITKPKAVILANPSCFKNFWEPGKYKMVLKYLKSSKKYPNGYTSNGISVITQQNNQIVFNIENQRIYTKNEEDNKTNEITNIAYTWDHVGKVIGQLSNSLGSTRIGYLTLCTPTKTEYFWESDSEAHGKKIWYKQTTTKTKTGYISIHYLTDNLNKQWTLAFKNTTTRMVN